MSPRRLLVVVAMAVLGASCNNDDPVTATGPTVPFSTEYFTGVIDAGGSRFWSFKVTTPGPVTVTLASIVNADTGLPLGRPLRVGVGRPQGTGCPVLSSAMAPAGLVSQVTHLAPEGVNCVEVADTSGTPSAAIRFALRFTHP